MVRQQNIMTSQNKVLLISQDVIGDAMAGPGIRYWTMANELAAHCDVTLAAPGQTAPKSLPGTCKWLGYALQQQSALLAQAERSDVIICQNDMLHLLPELTGLKACIVIDNYDPVMAEWMEVVSGEPVGIQQSGWIHRMKQLTPSYLRGDFYLCASERQRAWLLGMLEANGRINPLNAENDRAFTKFVAVVPNGIPTPRTETGDASWRSEFPGIHAEDKLVVWAGGLWPWLDAEVVVRAMLLVHAAQPDIKLIFPGTHHPNPALRGVHGAAEKIIALAGELGLRDRAIFFKNWTDYAAWPGLLSECSLALTFPLRENHETYLAFRTRLLDCIAAGLPLITSGNDVTADLVRDLKIGEVLDAPTPLRVAESILKWVRHAPQTTAAGFAEARMRFEWRNTLAPLIAYCQFPRIAPDRAAGQASDNQQSLIAVDQMRAHMERDAGEIERLKSLIKGYESGRFIQTMARIDRLRLRLQATSKLAMFLGLGVTAIRQALHELRNNGVRGVATFGMQIVRQVQRGGLNSLQVTNAHASRQHYKAWLARHEPTNADFDQQRASAAGMRYQPTISLLTPVFNTPEPFLRAMIDSVRAQTWPRWQLCIVDDASTKPHVWQVLEHYAALDARICIQRRAKNGHISAASNDALAMAQGEFVATLDHDDVLRPNALFEMVSALNQQPDLDMLYSDEDKLAEDGSLDNPYFKPDWAPDFFLSTMYTAHFAVYRSALLRKIGGYRLGYEGAQDWDMVLRLTEQTTRIHHVPKVLYSWRMSGTSTAQNSGNKGYAHAAAKRAIQDALTRRNANAILEDHKSFPGHYLIRQQLRGTPKVSILMCTRDKPDYLQRCIASIFEKSDYENFELIVIDNGSVMAETAQLLADWSRREPVRFRTLRLEIPFNFSQLNNIGARSATGDLLLLMNNDMAVITPHWLREMAAHAMRPEIGAVGATLLYPNGTIQHAGVVSGIGPWAGHSHRLFPGNNPGYFGRLLGVSEYSAVTGACLMMRKDLYWELGGLDEALTVACNDVELCWRALDAGLRNLILPHIRLYHYESVSRGYEESYEQRQRYQREIDYAHTKHPRFRLADPYYSIHLTKRLEDFSLTLD